MKKWVVIVVNGSGKKLISYETNRLIFAQSRKDQWNGQCGVHILENNEEINKLPRTFKV